MPFVWDDHAQASIVINATGDPEPMITTYAFAFIGAPEPIQANWDAAANALLTATRARMVTTYTAARVDFIYRAGGVEKAATSTSGAGAGLVTGDALPQNCAYLVRKRSSLTGRKNRGRMYVPGLREAQVDNLGIITGSEVTALQNAWNTAWTYFDGTTPWTGSAILHDDGGLSQPTLVTALEIDNVIATQRRRLRR